MHLNNLKSAWKQVKIRNAMRPLDPEEILSIIEGSKNTEKAKIKRVLLDMAMVIIITMIFQGG